MATFDDCLNNLFTFADQVTKYNGNGDMSMRTSNVDPIGTKIRKFKAVYDKTKTSPKHLEKFQEVYSSCRRSYLNSEDFDNFMLWFEKQSFNINITKDIYFPLSIIFRKSCTIARTVDEQADKDTEATGHVGSTYPEMFMLYLFKIFVHASIKEDLPKINETIGNLEFNLGLKEGENPDPVDGLVDIVSLASDALGEAGVQIPKDALNVNEFKKAISGISKNPDTKNTIKKMLSGLNLDSKGDISSTFGQIFSKMKDNASELPEALQRSMSASVENPTGSVASSSR